MRTLVLILFMICTIGSFAKSSSEIVQQAPIVIEKYDLQQENTLLLEVDFAKDVLLNKQQRDQLMGQSIYRVELVFTRYRASENFNQAQLNEDRINRLLQVIPELQGETEVSWGMVEQTGAATASEADEYFHGFVIHYGESLGYQSMQQYLMKWQDDFSTYSISAQQGGTIEHPSGTVIHFPPFSMYFTDGKPVHGNVEVQYREFRDQADIAFSGIPMTFTEDNGEELNFSSVGMFELRANQNGKELALRKAVTVDFQATEGLPGVDYYQMDDSTGQWSRLQEINPDTVQESVAITTWKDMFSQGGAWVYDDGYGVKMTMTYRGNRVEIDRPYLPDTIVDLRLDSLFEKDPLIVEKCYLKPGEKLETLRGFVSPFEAYGFWGRNFGADSITSTTEEITEAYQNYNSMIGGLRTESFGVYNCDQVYRIKNPVQVLANYVDKQTGENIDNKLQLCLIDLDYNASFSFSPNYFSSGAESKNALALFTADGEVFLISPEEYKKMEVDENGAYTFAMQNMTDKIKSTDDLRTWLDL